MPVTTPAIAVTPHGAIRYNSVREAINSFWVRLEDPIFVQDRAIDVTFFPVAGLNDYTSGDPWAYLLDRATTRDEPEGKKRRVLV